MIRRPAAIPRALLLACVLLAVAVGAGEPPLHYDAGDLLDGREGTIEFWFRPDFDLAQACAAARGKAYLHLLDLVHCTTGHGSFAIFLCARNGDGPLLHASQVSDRGDLRPFAGRPPALPPGHWHHFAVTWKDAAMTLYIDGKPVAQGRQNSGYAAALGGFESLAIGGQNVSPGARFAIDDLRLSTVARRPAELGAHGPLRADIYTTQLERFDRITGSAGKNATLPEVTVNGRGGALRRGTRCVPGHAGPALSLHAPPVGPAAGK